MFISYINSFAADSFSSRGLECITTIGELMEEKYLYMGWAKTEIVGHLAVGAACTWCPAYCVTSGEGVLGTRTKCSWSLISWECYFRIRTS